MENLVEIVNNQVVVNSRQVAEKFEKNHYHILRDIREYLNLSKNGEINDWFCETTYNDDKNRTYPMYLMNKNGFSLIAMGFTGKQVLEWKIKYIEAFEYMEKQLKEFNRPTISSEEIKIRTDELQIKKAEILIQLQTKVAIPEYQQILNSHIAEIIVGRPVLPLPEVNEKTYSATEIGQILGVSAQRVGKLANANNLKTDKYGKWFYDKSRYSDKEVESFRYYENVIEPLKKLLV